MATADEIIAVRESIGELIPEGGSEGDTLFPDARISAWIDESSSLDAASLRGWKAKLASLSNLVDVTDGAASRALSDAFDHAQEMVRFYTKLAIGPSAGRTRVGKIVRQ